MVFTRADAFTWEATQLIKDIIDLRVISYNKRCYGPFVLLMSQEWKDHINKTYIVEGKCPYYPSVTIRERILHIDGIIHICISNRLMDWQVLLCQSIDGIN